MLILPQTAEVIWSYAGRNHYEERGYPFTKYSDVFVVDVQDLAPNCKILINFICDYCEEPFTRTFQDYNKNLNKTIHKDACRKCRGKKTKESNLINYGVGNIMHVNEVKLKQQKVIQDKYGVDNISKLDEIQEKKKKTTLQNHGVEYPFLIPEAREKSLRTALENKDEIEQKRIQTNRERYGVDFCLQSEELKNKLVNNLEEKYGVQNVFQLDEVKDKSKTTMVERYGYEHPLQVPEINTRALIKTKQTMFDNGTAPKSRQQVYLHNLIGGNLNYPVNTSSLDIAFPESMIYVEYDGSGHELNITLGKTTKEEFELKEQRRYYALKNRGWRQIRIISRNDLLPTDVKIMELINLSIGYLNSGHSWIYFDIDNSIVRCREVEKHYDFGELRKITQQDISA